MKDEKTLAVGLSMVHEVKKTTGVDRRSAELRKPDSSLGPMVVASADPDGSGHAQATGHLEYVLVPKPFVEMAVALVMEQRGANQILILEIDEKRRRFAQELGFRVARPEDAPSSTADCLFIAAGAAEAISAIPELLASLGVGVVVGIIRDAPLNWTQLLYKEGSVITSRYFTLRDYQEAIRLLEAPGFKAKSLIQEQVAFADLFVDEGEKVMNRAQQVMRLLIKM